MGRDYREEKIQNVLRASMKECNFPTDYWEFSAHDCSKWRKRIWDEIGEAQDHALGMHRHLNCPPSSRQPPPASIEHLKNHKAGEKAGPL